GCLLCPSVSPVVPPARAARTPALLPPYLGGRMAGAQGQARLDRDRRERDDRLGRKRAALAHRRRSRRRPPSGRPRRTGRRRSRAVKQAAAADYPRSLPALLDDSRLAAALLALAAVFLLFHDLGGAALFNPDEGRNAEIAREVLETGDWITPYYNFLPRIEKPMLFYAAAAARSNASRATGTAARSPAA